MFSTLRATDWCGTWVTNATHTKFLPGAGST
jgi:hypothetical protein